MQPATDNSQGASLCTPQQKSPRGLARLVTLLGRAGRDPAAVTSAAAIEPAQTPDAQPKAIGPTDDSSANLAGQMPN